MSPADVNIGDYSPSDVVTAHIVKRQNRLGSLRRQNVSENASSTKFEIAGGGFMRKSFNVQHLATRGLSRGDEYELGLHELTNR